MKTRKEAHEVPSNIFNKYPSYGNNHRIERQNSCELHSSFSDHKKQGINFVNEENIKVRDLCKFTVGQTIVICDSAFHQESINTPDTYKKLQNQLNQNLKQQIQIGALSLDESSHERQDYQYNFIEKPAQQLNGGNSVFNSNSNLNLNNSNSLNNNLGSNTHLNSNIHPPNKVTLQLQTSGIQTNLKTNSFNSLNNQKAITRSPVNQEIESAATDKEQGSKIFGSQTAFDEFSKKERNILAPFDTQNALSVKRKSLDTNRSNNNQLAVVNQERQRAPSADSPSKPFSQELDSFRKIDLSKHESRVPEDTHHNTENILNSHTRKGAATISGNKSSFSLKFLTSIKPKLKKFIHNRTIFGRTRMISNSIRNYIDDSVDFVKFSKHSTGQCTKLFNSFFYNFQRILKLFENIRIPLFDPESKIKIAINSIIVAYNCFYMILISLELIFDAEVHELQEIFNMIAIGSWITEMIMEMNTVCYHNNHFVTDRRHIIKIYAKEYFFFEILPLIFEGRSSSDTLINVLLHLPLLLKIKGMSIILAKLEFYILQILERHYIFQLVKLVLQMILYGHLVACCWNLIVKIEIHLLDSETWLDGSEIESEEWWQRYVMALYWAFSVMMNVSTKPMTTIELAFTSCIMLLSCIAFGYLLSTIAAVIDELNKQQKDYKRDLNILNSFMKRKKLDLSLKRRVNINLKTYYQQKSKDNIEIEKQALGKLSKEMLLELNVQANSRILKQFPFFLKLFSEQTLNKMYSIMEEEVYAPQQIIKAKSINQQNDQYLYFIIKGSGKMKNNY